MTDCHRPPKQI